MHPQVEAALAAKGAELSAKQADAAADRQRAEAAEARVRDLEAEAERLGEEVASMQVWLTTAPNSSLSGSSCAEKSCCLLAA